MPEKAKEQPDRFLMIELSCTDAKCSPCTYPNCQRFARLQPKNKRFAAPVVKPIAVKTMEIDEKKEKKLEPEAAPAYPHHVNRYILAELSCSNSKCNPCTYPNCQRFAKTGKDKPAFKGIKVKVTEIKPDKEVKKLMADKKSN